MSRKTLTLVVPTYNRREILSRSLPSLLRQSADRERYEVVVVVDGSRDGTVEMLEGLDQQSRVKFVWQENKGLAAARNRGTMEASGDVVLFLDDDMVAGNDLVAAHLAAHADKGERVVFGALGLAPGVRRSFLKLGVEEWGREIGKRLSRPGYRFRFDDCHFGHASVSRSLLLRVGGFDEEFIEFGNEDYELGWRLIQQGVEMRYEPQAVANQIYDKTFRRWRRDVYFVGHADVALSDKHPDLEPHLRYRRPVRHPVKRAIKTLSQWPVDPLAPAWGVATAIMDGLERWGAKGMGLCHLQSMIGERWYWRGVRDARQRQSSCGVALMSERGKVA